MPDGTGTFVEPGQPTEKGIDAVVLVAVLAPIVGFVALLAVPAADVDLGAPPGALLAGARHRRRSRPRSAGRSA